MRRFGIAAAVLGFLAIPAMADDHGPYVNGNGSYAMPAMKPWLSGIPTAGYGSNCNGGCSTCGASARGDRRDRLQKYLDYILFRPTIPCDTRPRVERYVPPLYAWFPCRGEAACPTPCGTCATHGIRVTARWNLVGPRSQACGGCGAAALGTPVSVAASPHPQSNTFHTTISRPTLSTFTTFNPPAPLLDMRSQTSAPAAKQPEETVWTTSSGTRGQR